MSSSVILPPRWSSWLGAIGSNKTQKVVLVDTLQQLRQRSANDL